MLGEIVEAIGVEPYFRDEAVVIYHADCRDILPKMPKVDLVLTDQQMPEISGVGLCRRLRAHEKYARTPLLLTTALLGNLDLPRMCDELGIAATFDKPFDPHELVRTIESCLASGTPQPKI